MKLLLKSEIQWTVKQQVRHNWRAVRELEDRTGKILPTMYHRRQGNLKYERKAKTYED